ncbi:transcriptional regulator, TetR family [Thermodesulfobium narugense DSM 14796]|uniref:Transcriptional regulator, TetR family n=1 Tax=Thermodesulfobium narugense DSM 14796 TaxID=747365 RepID=M1E7B2_9BACT|nr:TetR/AcrR family transcriptional regulator [Thermodesulfobium narugense]AEE13904.1 transcriptional regulator, TetR family [Thermodesulfobium narugense DSM 14796]
MRTKKTSVIKNRILKSALRLFSNKGYHYTNVDEIVEDSNTSKGAFYFYFPGKKDLVIKLVEELSDQLIKKIETKAKGDTFEEIFRSSLKEGFRILDKYRELTKFIFIEAFSLGPQFEEQRFSVRKKLEKLFCNMLSDQRFEEIEKYIVVTIIVGAITEFVIDSITSDKSLAEISDLFIEKLLKIVKK